MYFVKFTRTNEKIILETKKNENEKNKRTQTQNKLQDDCDYVNQQEEDTLF